MQQTHGRSFFFGEGNFAHGFHSGDVQKKKESFLEFESLYHPKGNRVNYPQKCIESSWTFMRRPIELRRRQLLFQHNQNLLKKADRQK